MMFVNRIKNYQ